MKKKLNLFTQCKVIVGFNLWRGIRELEKITTVIKPLTNAKHPPALDFQLINVLKVKSLIVQVLLSRAELFLFALVLRWKAHLRTWKRYKSTTGERRQTKIPMKILVRCYIFNREINLHEKLENCVPHIWRSCNLLKEFCKRLFLD